MIKSLFAAAALAALSATAASAQTAPAQDHSGHAMPAPAAPAAALPTIDSSIRDLLANPATAAVLEKHLPGVGSHPALPEFQDMTLAEVAPMSGGQVSDDIIAAIDADLKALSAQ